MPPGWLRRRPAGRVGIPAESAARGRNRRGGEGVAVDTSARLCYVLSADRRVLVVKHRVPAGVRTITLHRENHASPFSDADVNAVLASLPAARAMLPGQRNITRRAVSRFGTLWMHVMLGPPTWRRPRLRRE